MEIIDRLLDLLSILLSGQPYKPLGAPPLLRGETPSMTRDHNAAEVFICVLLGTG